jgi:hypothetical protein
MSVKTRLAPISHKSSFASLESLTESIRERFWKVADGKYVVNQEGHLRVIDESDRRILGGVLVESKKDFLYDLVVATQEVREFDGVVFRQGEPRIIDGKVNLWGRKEDNDWYRMFRGWVIYGLCNGDKAKADEVLSWISDRCRHPEVKPKKAIAVKRGSKQAHFFFSLIMPYFCYGMSKSTGASRILEVSDVPWDMVYVENIDCFSASELKEIVREIVEIENRGLKMEVNDTRGFVFGSKNGDFRKIPVDYLELHPVDAAEYGGLFVGRTGNDEFWQKIRSDVTMRW